MRLAQRPARPASESSLTSKLTQRGDLTLRDTPLADALFTIAQIWEVNFVVGADIEGQFIGTFQDAPLYEILDAVLLSNGYGYRPVGRSLVVMPVEQLGDINPMFETATIPLRYIAPDEILEAARLLSSPGGRVETIASARSVMVVDFADRVTMIRQFIENLDRASGQVGPGGSPQHAQAIQVAHFTPQNVSADSLKESVEIVLSEKGKVAAVQPENQLVVADFTTNLELARKIVQDLDVPRRQVHITAFIYDMGIQDIERLGINWNQLYKNRQDGEGNPQSVANIDSILSMPINGNAADGTMTFMYLSRYVDLTAIVHCLQEATDSRLLANPNVTVLDHEQATMSIVTEHPYQELTQTQQGGQIGTTSFREAGIKLDVTPHLAADGTVRMEISPSFSRLTGYTPTEQPQPIIDRREASTTVRVADGQVLVIGGLRQRNDTGDFNGLPYLKDLRFLHLGALFRGRETVVRESELVVFIKPEIVTTTHIGPPRAENALGYGQCLLDQIPEATGGHPAYRPIPCHPPLPMDGPRIENTPYQPDTCTPPNGCAPSFETPSLHGPIDTPRLEPIPAPAQHAASAGEALGKVDPAVLLCPLPRPRSNAASGNRSGKRYVRSYYRTMRLPPITTSR
jgi:general secretion pathway protein D